MASNFASAEPGVMYSSLGINGANITLLSHAFNEAHWTAELHHYKPDLVVMNYGTNESGFPKFVDATWGREMTAGRAAPAHRAAGDLHTADESHGSRRDETNGGDRDDCRDAASGQYRGAGRR